LKVESEKLKVESEKLKVKSEKFKVKSMKRFEDLIAWQRAKLLCVEIYKVFEKSKDFGFKDQIQRASVSVMNNIAEGFERKSNKEFVYFLFVAKGSCGEVRSMLVLAEELNKISLETAGKIKSLAEELSKVISGLIKSVGSGKSKEES
jgi:four helix bundle protein